MSSGPSGKLMPYGSDLSYSNDGGTTYTVLGEIMLIHPPSPTIDKASATVLDSPGAIKEFLSSWGELGVVPFGAFFTQAQYNTLLGYLLGGASRYWRVRLPLLAGQATPAKFVFQAFLTKLEFSEGKAEENNPYSYDGELTISTYTGFVFTAGA